MFPTTARFEGRMIFHLPPEIGELSNLRELNLSKNKLTTLPEEFGKLKNLTKLNLSRNQLTKLPPQIGNLYELVAFDLSFNKLVTLPCTLGKLINLKVLDIIGNQLIRLPQEIGTLLNLNYLELEGNTKLVYPPYSMVESNNVAKEVVEYCGTHKDISYPEGRRKNMWKSLRLMYIAQHDVNCSFTFGILPIELIGIIELYAISDPYIEIKE